MAQPARGDFSNVIDYLLHSPVSEENRKHGEKIVDGIIDKTIMTDLVAREDLVNIFARHNDVKWVCEKNLTGSAPGHKICSAGEKCLCGEYAAEILE